MSLEYIHIPINNEINDIDEFININEKINELHNILSNNISLNFNYNTLEGKNNNFTNKISIKNINFYIKINQNIELNNFENNCSICYNHIFKNKSKVLLCNHSFCKDCFNNWADICIKKSLFITCPLCRKNIE